MQLPASIPEAAGWLAYHFDKIQPFLPTYAHLLISALLPIYAGSHASLSRPASAAKPAKKARSDGTPPESDSDDDEAESEAVQKMEGLSTSDALLFPVLAGATLTSLYFLIKWLEDPALLNRILNWYFASFSILSVCRLVSDALDVLHSVLFPRAYVDGGRLYRVDPKRRLAVPAGGGSGGGDQSRARETPLPGPFSRVPLPRVVRDFLWFLYVVPNQKLTFSLVVRSVVNAQVKLGIHGFEGIAVGLLTVVYYNFVAKPWFLTNLFGFGFSYGALQLMSPTTFSTGTLLLSLLFFYDIYFVFFTPMMVGVAKSLDVPVKLLFPAPPKPGQAADEQSLSMLGLGDIVLPGIMIGLALRFDLWLFYFYKQTTKTTTPADGDAERKTEVVKAPYRSVAEGWGDRLWSSYAVSHFFSPLSKKLPTGSYTPRGAFPKPYFTASMLGYLAGMLTTLIAMQVSNHPQPALLYLVPGVLGSIWLTAVGRGELKLMWAYSDAAEEEEGEKTDGDAKETSEKSKDDADKKTEAKEAQDTAKDAKSEKTAGQGSIVDRLAGRLEKQLESYDPTADEASDDGEDRTLFAFTVKLPPLLQPAKESTANGSVKWKESQQTSRGDKADVGHADKRMRVS